MFSTSKETNLKQIFHLIESSPLTNKTRMENDGR